MEPVPRPSKPRSLQLLRQRPTGPPVPSPRGHASRTLALSGLASGVLAGAGIATAAALREEVLASPDPSSAHPGLVAANRVVGYTAGGLGVAAIGLGVSAVIVGRW